MKQSKHDGIRVEDYLTTIYRFEEAFGYARTTDISKELRISPATVSKVVKKLEEKDYVKRVKYKHIQLTENGRRIAEQIIKKHRIAETFLYRVLGFNELESHYYAHDLEHLPDIVIEKLYEISGKPLTCPHGNKIPGVESTKEELANLIYVRKNTLCVIKKIAGEFIDVLEFLHNIGLAMESALTIVDSTEHSLIVKLNERLIKEIPIHIARFVYVKCK